MRELRRQGATVRVSMTKAAQEFITPLTMQSLSGDAVLTDYFDASQEEKFGHLHLARWADAYVVLPATADLLARIAAGMANDAVTTSLLAFRGPVLLAPAMNTAMWEHPATQRNLALLRGTPQTHFVGPATGPLADGDVGAGRLSDLGDLIDAVKALFAGAQLAGKKVLITAGPTREAMDPVRFISNPSTGKMGLAMAHEAHARGAAVTVVLGPVGEVGPFPFEVVRVITADDMLEAVMKRVEHADIFVATAAVSDWKPQSHLDAQGEEDRRAADADAGAHARRADDRVREGAGEREAARAGGLRGRDARRDRLREGEADAQRARPHRRQRRVGAGRRASRATPTPSPSSAPTAPPSAAQGHQARGGRAAVGSPRSAEWATSMSDEVKDIALELRRHLAWQESDGTRVLLKEPSAGRRRREGRSSRGGRRARAESRAPVTIAKPAAVSVALPSHRGATRSTRSAASWATASAASCATAASRSSSAAATRAPSWSSWAKAPAKKKTSRAFPSWARRASC